MLQKYCWLFLLFPICIGCNKSIDNNKPVTKVPTYMEVVVTDSTTFDIQISITDSTGKVLKGDTVIGASKKYDKQFLVDIKDHAHIHVSNLGYLPFHINATFTYNDETLIDDSVYDDNHVFDFVLH